MRGQHAYPGTVKPGNVPSMEGLAAAVVLIAILLGVLLLVAFDVFCLARLAARDDRGLVRKLVWAVAIVCISPFGGLVYLLSTTKLTPYAPRIGDGSLRRLRLRPVTAEL
jgi:hypothetical protein